MLIAPSHNQSYSIKISSTYFGYFIQQILLIAPPNTHLHSFKISMMRYDNFVQQILLICFPDYDRNLSFDNVAIVSHATSVLFKILFIKADLY